MLTFSLVIISFSLLKIIEGTFSSGGNGNPAILLMPVFFALYVWLLWRLFNKYRTMRVSISKIVSLSFLVVILFIFTSYKQSSILKGVREKLESRVVAQENHIDPQYLYDLTNGLTQATNAVYFNFWTYICGIALCIVISLWFNYVDSHITKRSRKV